MPFAFGLLLQLNYHFCLQGLICLVDCISVSTILIFSDINIQICIQIYFFFFQASDNFPPGQVCRVHAAGASSGASRSVKLVVSGGFLACLKDLLVLLLVVLVRGQVVVGAFVAAVVAGDRLVHAAVVSVNLDSVRGINVLEQTAVPSVFLQEVDGLRSQPIPEP